MISVLGRGLVSGDGIEEPTPVVWAPFTETWPFDKADVPEIISNGFDDVPEWPFDKADVPGTVSNGFGDVGT